VPPQCWQRPAFAGAAELSLERPQAKQYRRKTRRAALRNAARCSADRSSSSITIPTMGTSLSTVAGGVSGDNKGGSDPGAGLP